MKLPGFVRSFNKHILNHLTGRLARSSFGLFAVVYHVGRRSGRSYETTIMLVPVDSGFVISLTYGAKVDWYRNVMAAGRCRVLWHGKRYAIERIETMDVHTALPLFPQPERFALRLMGIRDFITMPYEKEGQPIRA